MKSKNLLVTMLLMAALPISAQYVSNDNDDGVNKIDTRIASHNAYRPGEVLVKFSDNQMVEVKKVRGKFSATSVNTVTGIMQKYGVEEMEQLLPSEKAGRPLRKARAYNGDVIQEKDLSQLYHVKLDEAHQYEVHQLVEELKAVEEVEFAEPNYLMFTLEEQPLNENYETNPLVSAQWYLDSYGVKELWTKPVINPKRPVIAILDTGVDIGHPDLVDNIWTNAAEEDGEEGYDNDNNGFMNDVHGWDFINNSPNIRDNNMHGTHVAGIAAASNNDIGIVGANPNAYIMPVTVMQSDGTGDVATIIKGIDYAVKNGATVLNFSLGMYAKSSSLRQALEKAYQSCVIVAAAGNDGRCCYESHYPSLHQYPIPAPMFPAAYSFVLGVQATTQDGGLASFSNYDDDGATYSCESGLSDPDGYNYELKAPGANIISTIPGGKYKELNGTSMAAPLVAGSVSALLMAKEYDNQEILWGDLLHTSNIAEAYNITERPAELDLMRLQMQNRKDLADESEADYSNDHEIDAGEIVSIYPVIRTTFGEASNIKLKLEMGDEFEDPSVVEFQTPEADFGLHLDAYGKGVSVNPLVLKVGNDVADARHIKLKVTATCDESDQTFEYPFAITVTNMVKISGLISENTTLTADHVYYVNEDLVIMEGTTLTIEPGTRIEVAKNVKISSFGKLDANGTPDKLIVFTKQASGEPWAGLSTHESKNGLNYPFNIYTNSDSTLFTILPTENTSIRYKLPSTRVYYNPDTEISPVKVFYLNEYMDYDDYDMTARQNLLTDPDYLTSPILQLLHDYNEYVSHYPLSPSEEKTSSALVKVNAPSYYTIYDNPRDTISYCVISGFGMLNSLKPDMRDCIIDAEYNEYDFLSYLSGARNNIMNATHGGYLSWSIANLTHSNIVNNKNEVSAGLMTYSGLNNNNFFNNISTYDNHQYLIGIKASEPKIDKAEHPSYLGTGREDLIRPYVWEMGNAPGTYGSVDLSNMRTTPVSEAHGIVWKVVVNGYDAQDEFEDLPPLGVGRHKFEVYFNRPMNKEVAPSISFGIRDPYTQNAVAEDGGWNEEGTIYTAYYTITGKTKSDGLNRIYVYGAEDNEFFEIPYEKSRFNINIQAAGSMATGFAAEAGLGRVNLTWNNENNNFDDAMGFNVYRYTVDDEGMADTLCVNTDIIDINATAFADYDVTPGETYYYYYKVLSTDLQEYDISNVVAATPLTSVLGDANGSGEVDVADVITTVNYAAGLDPKPFIFEAADMNADQQINVLDVVGVIYKILHPEDEAKARVESSATYTIEDGILYVESPVALAGVQVQLNSPEHAEPTVLEAMSGFEHAAAWLTNEDYLFLAYNMTGKTLPAGKHAILALDGATLRDIRLSDAYGTNVNVNAGDATSVIDMSVSTKLTANGVYNLNGQKVAGTVEELNRLPRGIYIVDGKKVVK